MFQSGMQEGQDRLNITLMRDPGEAAETEEIFDLLFDKVVDQNITYTIKNFEALGAIDFSAWPVHPRIWIQGIRNWLRMCTNAMGDQLNKAMLQITPNVLAVTCKLVPQSLVPQIHHPLVAEVQVADEEDQRAEWVKFCTQSPNNINPPDSRHVDLWTNMANLTVSDPSFRLVSREEKLPIAQTLEESLDFRKQQAHTCLWHILSTQEGYSPLGPEDLVVQDVETVDQLKGMLKDLEAYGAPNYEYPPKIFMGGEERPEITEVFSLDIEGINIDNHYCTSDNWHEAVLHRT